MGKIKCVSVFGLSEKCNDVAIDWALGKRKLSKKIIAESNFAAVKVVIDNADKSLILGSMVVEVERRMFISGASEFYINKVACRLSDIKGLTSRLFAL